MNMIIGTHTSPVQFHRVHLEHAVHKKVTLRVNIHIHNALIKPPEGPLLAGGWLARAMEWESQGSGNGNGTVK